jgi:PKHD-type hydroxylase
MLVHIPEVLTKDELAQCRRLLSAAPWVDGKVTAGYQSGTVKDNRQIPEDHPAARELAQIVVKALARNPLFTTAALPLKVFPPLFNRYEGGDAFGTHIDNAMRKVPNGPDYVRTDLSATLFISDPADYDGGELLIDDNFGVQRVKLPAGSLVLYPASSLHQVTPVTRGARVASFFWIQSMVRDDGQRTMLFDLDTAIRKLTAQKADQAALVQLTGVYHNLLRRWGDA